MIVCLRDLAREFVVHTLELERRQPGMQHCAHQWVLHLGCILVRYDATTDH